MIVDTHTHLYLDEFDDGGASAVVRALDAGVGRLVFPNIDLASVAPMRGLHSRFPRETSMAIGLHPTEVNGDDVGRQLKFVEDELANNGGDYVAIGEIGIDLYWDKTYREEQMEAFVRQADLAAKLDLPIIIHCREGLDETLEALDSLEKMPRGVFHSFGGTKEDVEAIRRRGDFFFGINGIVTFKNSRLREVLPAIGTDRILLETDSPYLAPVPHRGKRNESAFIVHTAAYVADALGMSKESIENITTESAVKLFGL